MLDVPQRSAARSRATLSADGAMFRGASRSSARVSVVSETGRRRCQSLTML